MDIETEDMIAALADAETIDIDNFHFVRGSLDGYPVIVSRTEQGISNAAVTTALAMQNFDPTRSSTRALRAVMTRTCTPLTSSWARPAYRPRRPSRFASAEGAGVDYKAIEKNGGLRLRQGSADLCTEVRLQGGRDPAEDCTERRRYLHPGQGRHWRYRFL